MKGSVFKVRLRDGRVVWRFMIDAGRGPDGRRLRITKSGFARERDAVEAMHAAMRELDAGSITAAPTTLAEWLDDWLPRHAATKPLEPTTAERYQSLANRAKRALGQVKLKDLSTHILDRFYASLQGELAPKSIREIHNVLHVSLRRAVKAGLIPRNPADGADLPRVDQKEPRALSSEELAKLQQAAAGTWLDLFIRLVASTGLRRGEALALRWSDVDWFAGTLRVERSLYQTAQGKLGIKSTKTRQNRTIALPQSVLSALRFHRDQQEQDRAFFGPDYRHDLDLIFATPSGEYRRPDSVSWAVRDLAKRAGLHDVSLHTLRHAHASALLAAGVPPANIARRLGHRDVATTLKIYSHALPNLDGAVASLWDKFLAGDLRFGTSWHIGGGEEKAMSLKDKGDRWRPQRDSNPRYRRERAVS